MELNFNLKNDKINQNNGEKYNLSKTTEELKLEITTKADSPENLIDMLFSSEELKAYPEINGWREKMLDSISKSKDEDDIFEKCSYEDSSGKFEINLLDDATDLYQALLIVNSTTSRKKTV